MTVNLIAYYENLYNIARAQIKEADRYLISPQRHTIAILAIEGVVIQMALLYKDFMITEEEQKAYDVFSAKYKELFKR